MSQDGLTPNVLQCLVTPELGKPGDFQKLRSVVVRRGEIRGELPDTIDAEGYWNPFDAYANGEKPHMDFAGCGPSDEDVKHFMERYGPIGEVIPDPNLRTVSYRLFEFRMKQWQFRFARFLGGSLLRPFILRAMFLKHVKNAYRNVKRIDAGWRAADRQPRFYERADRWRSILLNIGAAVRMSLPQYVEEHRAAAQIDPWEKVEAAWVKRLSEHITTLEEKKLIGAADYYLTQELWERLKRVRLLVQFRDGEALHLSANCPDLLSAFYYMLAKDWDAGRSPLVCAHCKEIFLPKRKDAVYCSKRECKELGRKRASWERHKPEYALRRKKKRQKEMRLRNGARRNAPNRKTN